MRGAWCAVLFMSCTTGTNTTTGLSAVAWEWHLAVGSRIASLSNAPSGSAQASGGRPNHLHPLSLQQLEEQGLDNLPRPKVSQRTEDELRVCLVWVSTSLGKVKVRAHSTGFLGNTQDCRRIRGAGPATTD